MRVIGVTGSSGTGKSTICEIFEQQYDVKIIDADKIAKRLSKKSTSYINEIVRKFGPDILDEDGELNRKKLAEIIYADSEKRKELNNCTFKYIIKEIEKEIEEEIEVTTIIIDAPLLFESELDKICNYVIGVVSDKNLQIERIVARDNIDYESAENRLDAQENNDFYISRCDEIIQNNNDIVYIEKCIKKIAEKYNITKKLQ